MVKTASRFEFVGGNLALDFTNTVTCFDWDDPVEQLGAYADLVAWAEEAGAVDAAEARALARLAASRPREAGAALERARAARRAIYDVVSAAAAGERPGRAALDALNREVAAALAHTRLEPRDGAFELGWDDERTLDRVLWPVLRSTADLLASDGLARVRQCGGPDCTWLFLDKSKNASRRWCEMKSCGNREKSRKHRRGRGSGTRDQR